LTHPAKVIAKSSNGLAPLSSEARFERVFRKEGLESLVPVGFLTLFAEIACETSFKAERVAGVQKFEG